MGIASKCRSGCRPGHSGSLAPGEGLMTLEGPFEITSVMPLPPTTRGITHPLWVFVIRIVSGSAAGRWTLKLEEEARGRSSRIETCFAKATKGLDGANQKDTTRNSLVLAGG